MTNLFTRIRNTVIADLNDVLDQKENKNPIALLNQYLRECEDETEKVKKLVERQFALKQGFAREYHEADELATKRKAQAEIALKAGEMELHSFASQEAMHYEERAARLKESLRYTESQLHELEQKYEEMKHKLKDMHIRRMELMGKENVSRAQLQISKVINNDAYSNKPYSRFQEIETYLDRIEQQVNTNFTRHTIDARIAKLEKEMKEQETSL